MCKYCEDSLLIEIKNPLKNSQKKYEKATEIIEKALGYDSLSETFEVSPYKSVRQLIKQSRNMVERRLLELHNDIVTTWLGLTKAARSSFKLNGKIYISPSTGKPLTQAQWKIIKRDVMNAFSYVYGTQEDRIVKTALALGRLVATTPVGKMLRSGIVSMKPGSIIGIFSEDPYYRAAMQFAQESAGEHIVDLSQRQYKQIHDTILNAQINRQHPRQLESDLFQNFGGMNRDWRRIAETEIANNVNNGHLITELQKPREEGEYVYMEGISSGDACPWCASEVNGKVVVLLDEPPTGGGDQIKINDKTFTAIWPGKNNVGRRRANWWVAAGTQHPHCCCVWVRYEPGYEEYRAMIDEGIAETIEKIKREM